MSKKPRKIVVADEEWVWRVRRTKDGELKLNIYNEKDKIFIQVPLEGDEEIVTPSRVEQAIRDKDNLETITV